MIYRFLFPVLNILKFQKNLKHSRKKLNLILLHNNYALWIQLRHEIIEELMETTRGCTQDIEIMFWITLRNQYFQKLYIIILKYHIRTLILNLLFNGVLDKLALVFHLQTHFENCANNSSVHFTILYFLIYTFMYFVLETAKLHINLLNID